MVHSLCCGHVEEKRGREERGKKKVEKDKEEKEIILALEMGSQSVLKCTMKGTLVCELC